MPQSDQGSYGCDDEERTLALLHCLHECAKDAEILGFGLQVLTDDENDWQTEYLRSITAAMSERLAPFVRALSNEFLVIQVMNNEHPPH